MKYLSVLVAILFCADLHAQTAKTDERLTALLQRFPDADADKDGVLTREEAVAFREAMKSEAAPDRSGKSAARIPPTRSDFAYGDDERQRFDVWIPEKTDDPRLFPIYVYFHGGGFVSGDKSQFVPTPFLEAGIACVSVNYRLVDGVNHMSPTPFEDSARALQTVRHHAISWGLDPGRIALSGGSAGAVIAMWLGYHDDLAAPESDDPVSRESTRVTCLIPINGPTNLMPDWIVENVGGREQVHGSFAKLFGEPATVPVENDLAAKIKVISPWEFVTADDPPTYLVYSGPLGETPLPDDTSTGIVIHHPAFGRALKEKLDGLGVENDFRYGFDPRGTPNLTDYLLNQFGMVD